MVAACQQVVTPIPLIQGQDTAFAITCYSTLVLLANGQVDTENSVIQDLTGYTLPQMQIRRSKELSSPLLYTPTLSIAGDPTTGVVNFSVPASASVLWASNAWYDCFVVTPASNRIRILTGPIILDQSCTDIAS